MIEQAQRRESERHRCYIGGQVRYSDGRTIIDCMIKDMSATGAKLSMSNTAAVPANFELFIPSKNKSIRSVAVWRNHEEVGVQFMVERRHSDPAPELALRVGSLEKQIEVLRGQMDYLIKLASSGPV
jgi:hypothetical protein